MEYVAFGKTGLTVSRLCIGTGTHGWGHRSEQTGLGLDGLANLLRLAYDQGVTFWDSADQYGSHRHIAQALRGLPRDRVVIATKTNSSKAADVRKDVERFLRELNTDVLDVVLLHCMTQGDWPARHAEAMQELARAQEQGQVRSVGISCHSLAALRAAAETNWVQAVLVRINHAGVNMDAPPAEVAPVIEKLYRRGVGVYGMKVLGCGSLARDAHKAFEYVLGLGTVHALNIGISKREHLYEHVRLVEELAPRCPVRP